MSSSVAVAMPDSSRMRPGQHLDYIPLPPPPSLPASPTYPTPTMPTPEGMPGMVPAPTSTPEATNHKLGLSIVLVGAGAIIGYQVKGMMGALAGAALGGAGANAWKALRHYQEGNEVADQEAKVEATYAVLGTGLGVYLLHHISEKEAQRSTAYRANDEDDEGHDVDEPEASYDENDPSPEEDPESEPEVVSRGSCSVRRAGP
jgi:hypothetical protein